MAMIFDWLMQDEQGKQHLSDMIDGIRNEQRPRFFSDRLFGRFGSHKIRRGPDTQHFRVGDSDPIDPASCLAVFLPKRISVHGKPKQIPMSREGIDVETETQFQISIIKDAVQHPALQYWNEESTASLLERVYTFSQACIEHELQELAKAPETNKLAEYQFIPSLVDFYEHLLQSNSKETPYMRIGAGKTYYDQAIGIAIKLYPNYEEGESPDEFFKNFRKKERNMRPQQDMYPATRTVTPYFSDKELYKAFPFLPFGWLRLSAV